MKIELRINGKKHFQMKSKDGSVPDLIRVPVVYKAGKSDFIFAFNSTSSTKKLAVYDFFDFEITSADFFTRLQHFAKNSNNWKIIKQLHIQVKKLKKEKLLNK